MVGVALDASWSGRMGKRRPGRWRLRRGRARLGEGAVMPRGHCLPRGFPEESGRQPLYSSLDRDTATRRQPPPGPPEYASGGGDAPSPSSGVRAGIWEEQGTVRAPRKHLRYQEGLPGVGNTRDEIRRVG